MTNEVRDPRAKSVEGFIAALQIFAKYMPKGMEQKFFCGAEHDILYVYVDVDVLLPESGDGQALIALGFGPDEGGNWCYHT